MAEASVAVTAGAGTLLHTNTRTISASTMHDEFVLPGEYPYATYVISTASVITTTAAAHLLQIMAGASLNVRIRRIKITESTPPAAVTAFPLQLVRLTTAGTGGTAITAAKYDNADAAAGATGMTLPTAKGTEGTVVWDQTPWMGTTAVPIREGMDWLQTPNSKPIIIPAGTANGLAIKQTVGLATCTLTISVEFVETSFV